MRLFTVVSIGLAATLGSASNVLAFDPLGISNPAHHHSQTAVLVHGRAFAANDFLPAKTLIRNTPWEQNYHPKAGRNIALLNGSFEASVLWNGLRVGYVARQDWFAQANRDGLDIYRSFDLKQALQTGQSGRLDYEMVGYTAQGLALGGAFERALGQSDWHVAAGFGLNLLKGHSYRHDIWQTSLNTIASGVTVINGRVERDHARMKRDIFRDPVNFGSTPSGRGYALDLGLSFRHSNGWRVEWAAKDLLGEMRWRNIPYERLDALEYVVCQTSGIDCNNAKDPNVAPIFADSAGGLLPRTRNLKHKLKAKHRVVLGVPVAGGSLELINNYTSGVHLPAVGFVFPEYKGWKSRVNYDKRFGTVGVELGYKSFFVGYRADKLSLSKAKAYGLQTGFQWNF